MFLGRQAPVTPVWRRPKQSGDVRVRSTEQSVGIIVEGFCPNIEMNLTVGGTQKWKRNMM